MINRPTSTWQLAASFLTCAQQESVVARKALKADADYYGSKLQQLSEKALLAAAGGGGGGGNKGGGGPDPKLERNKEKLKAAWEADRVARAALLARMERAATTLPAQVLAGEMAALTAIQW